MCGIAMKVGHKLDVQEEEKSWPKEVLGMYTQSYPMQDNG
jgi:hypothetical protein